MKVRKRLKSAAAALLGREAASASQYDIRDIGDADRDVIKAAWPYTMTGLARILALLDAVEYVVRRGIGGAFAECGVWRGGSVLAMVLKLQRLGVQDRDIYLYDTFDGMTEPTDKDTSPFEAPAASTWAQAKAAGKRGWSQFFNPQTFNEQAVRDLILGTGYPAAKLHFIKGPVEKTIPGHAPDAISLLRLDTDWYESTRHELNHLYPRVSTGGILIIDDYGHWQGCRRAVDEFFGPSPAHAPLLSRIDYSARIAIKP